MALQTVPARTDVSERSKKEGLQSPGWHENLRSDHGRITVIDSGALVCGGRQEHLLITISLKLQFRWLVTVYLQQHATVTTREP